MPLAAQAAEEHRLSYPPEVQAVIPRLVGDGTAFSCSFNAPELVSVTVTFLERSVTAKADQNGEAMVLLPVPLDHADAEVSLIWACSFNGGTSTKKTTTVRIQKKIYPAQRLTLAPKYVTPDPALKERIARESKELNAALTVRTPVRHWTLPMQRPVAGKVTSWYGLRRILNGEPRNPHKGLDFRGAEGTPISCIANGTVVLTGDFYYPGMFAVVDHGLGVTSIYMHMSEILVRPGQTILAGDTVGRIGATGRSTGPHLHLGLTVLGQSIDAFPLLAMTKEDQAAYAKAFSDAEKAEKKQGTGNTAKKTSDGKAAAAKKNTGKIAAKTTHATQKTARPAQKAQ